jgi:hypothetical protein
MLSGSAPRMLLPAVDNAVLWNQQVHAVNSLQGDDTRAHDAVAVTHTPRSADPLAPEH